MTICVISEVSLLLNGQFKRNNSVIVWTEIGEGSGSLFCLTDKGDCCEANTGNWINPNNDTLSLMSTDGFYQGYRKTSVLLQHQGVTPTVQGIFRCDVIDANNKMQHLYIGIYSQAENGEQVFTLLCSCFHVCDRHSIPYI